MKKISLQKIPKKPGVYIFKDVNDSILYIGKATKLKDRISSYFRQTSQLTPQKQLMVEKISKLEFIITTSPSEALLLESNLIKKRQPPFNIDLKDDKNFLYIKISLDEEFPRVFTVRRISWDKARYFGPYVSAGSVRQTLRLLRKLFPHRNFSRSASKYHLNFLVKRYPQLLGPSDPREYRLNINNIIKFLKGEYRMIAEELGKKMARASHNRQYEKAATCRDQIQSIKRLMEKQIVVSAKRENQDIVSLAQNRELACINLFIIRQGILLNKQNFILKNIASQTEGEIIQAFLERYYPQTTDLPGEIILPLKLADQKIIENTFGVRIIVPQKGTKKKYLELGVENAVGYLEQQKASWEKEKTQTKIALEQFKKLLSLPHIPRRIETYDISNIQGQNPVGSMIVFTDGRPDKKWYRKFKIKSVKGANDTAMLAEMLKRRFGHLKLPPSPPAGEKVGMRGPWPRPDLVILDGGRGQLNTVIKAIGRQIPTVALAKKHENIYLPDREMPVNFPPDSPALFLIQRLRDEAHRFAIAFFRKEHGKEIKKSILDEIPGLGPKTKKKLLAHFSSTQGIAGASVVELGKIAGKKLVKIIKEYL
ncbi:MAG: excinuclease ABC subunit UvrC [Patescibacteria group bacterium]|jgi:excinuclease ABC subunit C